MSQQLAGVRFDGVLTGQVRKNGWLRINRLPSSVVVSPYSRGQSPVLLDREEDTGGERERECRHADANGSAGDWAETRSALKRWLCGRSA